MRHTTPVLGVACVQLFLLSLLSLSLLLDVLIRVFRNTSLSLMVCKAHTKAYQRVNPIHITSQQDLASRNVRTDHGCTFAGRVGAASVLLPDNRNPSGAVLSDYF